MEGVYARAVITNAFGGRKNLDGGPRTEVIQTEEEAIESAQVDMRYKPNKAVSHASQQARTLLKRRRRSE